MERSLEVARLERDSRLHRRSGPRIGISWRFTANSVFGPPEWWLIDTEPAVLGAVHDEGGDPAHQALRRLSMPLAARGGVQGYHRMRAGDEGIPGGPSHRTRLLDRQKTRDVGLRRGSEVVLVLLGCRKT
jgi:hypothetical protein